MTDPVYIGEVIESTSNLIRAEAFELDKPPDFGSIVSIPYGGDLTAFAIISEIQTLSVDPNRRPSALGLTREELKLQQPQIFHLLKTEFTAVFIGHNRLGTYYSYLPPKPPPIHAFITFCQPELVRTITSDFSFLQTLVSLPHDRGDELVAAALREAAQHYQDRQQFLIRGGKELVKILRGDYDRFYKIVRRLSQ